MIIIAKWTLAILLLGSLGTVFASEGHNVYKQTCAVCHSVDVPDAPRLGRIADWKNRLLIGRTGLLRSVLNGHGAMPPKGGDASLSDAEAEAALDYMLSMISSPR